MKLVGDRDEPMYAQNELVHRLAVQCELAVIIKRQFLPLSTMGNRTSVAHV